MMKKRTLIVAAAAAIAASLLPVQGTHGQIKLAEACAEKLHPCQPSTADFCWHIGGPDCFFGGSGCAESGFGWGYNNYRNSN